MLTYIRQIKCNTDEVPILSYNVDCDDNSKEMRIGFNKFLKTMWIKKKPIEHCLAAKYQIPITKLKEKEIMDVEISKDTDSFFKSFTYKYKFTKTKVILTDIYIYVKNMSQTIENYIAAKKAEDDYDENESYRMDLSIEQEGKSISWQKLITMDKKEDNMGFF